MQFRQLRVNWIHLCFQLWLWSKVQDYLILHARPKSFIWIRCLLRLHALLSDKSNLMCCVWVERFLTHRMVKASHVCSDQTRPLSQRKCNLPLKPESQCSSPAVNDVGMKSQRAAEKINPNRLALVPLTNDWLPGKQHYHFKSACRVGTNCWLDD